MNNPRADRLVLITGASGFTGRYLASALRSQGMQVHAPESLDLTNPESVARALKSVGPTAVVHLGAISFAAHGDSAAYYKTNALGTLNLLQAINAEGLQLSHFVFASSAAVYGDQGLALLDESLTPNPASDYGVSKLAAEHLVRLHSKADSTVIFRPFNYTGIGQPAHFIIPKLVSHYAQRKPTIELGNIDVAREFNDVRWAAEAYVAALSYQGHFATLNLCTGAPHSLRSVMAILKDITSHEPEMQVNAEFLRANDLPSLAGDPKKLNAAFELPSVIALENTLRWMCDHYATEAT